MSANKGEPGRLHPASNAEIPAELESENDPALGRRARYLGEERVASGGLDDDPTDSGDPVRNKKPFENLTGGR